MEKRITRIFWISLALLTAIRLFVISTTMVVDDEAHYFVWSKHLALGYIDNGPVVAYLIRLSTLLFGDNSFGVRVGGIIASVALTIFLFRFARKSFGALAGLVLTLLLGTSILFFSSSFILTPDTTMWIFMAVSLVYYYKAFMEDKRYFYPAGILFGIAAFSKVSVLFNGFGIFLFPFVVKEKRSFLKLKEFWLSFILAFLCFLPFIYWNIRNEYAFVSFKGTMAFRPGDIVNFLEFWGAQVGFLFPILFGLVFYLPFKVLVPFFFRRKETELKYLFFACATIVPLLFFFLGSFNSRYEPYWSVPFCLSGVFLAGLYVADHWQKMRKWFYVQVSACVLAILVMVVQIYCSLIPLPRIADGFRRYYKFTAFPGEIREFLATNTLCQSYRILAKNYQIPSMLIMYSHPKIEPSCVSVDGYHDTFFYTLHSDESLVGGDYLFLWKDEVMPSFFPQYFDSAEKVRTFHSYRRGELIDTYTLWFVKNYRGKNAPERPKRAEAQGGKT